jgi:hypothetical protein
MREIDRLRLIKMLTKAYEQAEGLATTYTYKGRDYRVRTVTVTVGEIGTPGGAWVPLGQDLTSQLLGHIASGEATVTERG